MRSIASLLITALLCFTFVVSGSIFAAPQARAEEKLPLDIHADEVVWDRKNGVITARGFAHATYGEHFLAADYMEYHKAAGNLEARGNVVFEYDDTRVFARRLDFNVNTSLGVLYDAEGYIEGAYFITGKTVERISQTEYKLKDGSLTTCRCDNPAWLVTLKQGTLHINRFAVLRGVTFRVKGKPVASLPIAVVPAKTERSTGFLFPSLGTSSLDGFTVMNKFFWAINEQSDATFGLDYLSERGFRPNLEYRYILSRNSRGKIFGSILDDRVRDTTFYRVRGEHYQRFRNDVVSMGKIDLESAVSPSRTFDLDVESRAKVRTDSFLYARKNWERRALQMENRFFKGTIEKGTPSFATLPELTFLNVREKLFETPLYYDFSLTGANFIEELPGGKNRNLSRLDFFPRLTFPVNSLSWWDFTQSMGFRETVYSEQRGSEKPLSRELFFLQSTLEAPRIYRSYNLRVGRIDRLVHIVEPVVTYTWVSDNDRRVEGRLLDFDEVDDFGASNVISYAFTNRFIVRETGESGRSRVREMARITLSQSYDIREERKRIRGKEPLSQMLIDVETWVVPALRVNFDGLYDFKEDGLETMNFEVDLSLLEYLNLEFDSRLKRGRSPAGSPRTDYIRAGIGARLSKKWYLEYAARINLLQEKKFTENSLIVSYKSQCWGITARLVDRFDETTIDFQVELTGIGGLGEKIGRLVNPDRIPRL